MRHPALQSLIRVVRRDDKEVTLSYTQALLMPNYTAHRIIFSEYIAGPASLT